MKHKLRMTKKWTCTFTCENPLIFGSGATTSRSKIAVRYDQSNEDIRNQVKNMKYVWTNYKIHASCAQTKCWEKQNKKQSQLQMGHEKNLATICNEKWRIMIAKHTWFCMQHDDDREERLTIRFIASGKLWNWYGGKSHWKTKIEIKYSKM